MGSLVNNAFEKLITPGTDRVLVDVTRWTSAQINAFQNQVMNRLGVDQLPNRLIIQRAP